jgi:hypothetical protein
MNSEPYNTNDGYVGFWIENTLYAVQGDTYQKGSRLYLGDTSFYATKTCNKNVSRYFEWYNFSSTWSSFSSTIFGDWTISSTIHMNGRRFYITDNKSIISFQPSSREKVNIPDKNTISLCKELIPFNNIEIDLANLICSQFSERNSSNYEEAKGSTNWPDLFSYLQKCSEEEIGGKITNFENVFIFSRKTCCTTIGRKIGTSLIKIAATRIFADPEQSILELPVNSMDSYFPELRVGKFGMGFFSFLYWLIGQPKRKLYIYSWFVENNINCGYCATLQEKNGNLSLKLRILETYTKQAGTYIYLDAENENFSQDVISNFGNQLNKLKFTDKVGIYFIVSKQKDDNQLKGFRALKPMNKYNGWKNVTMKNKIFVKLAENYIFIEDFAQGIPIQVLLGSLFVPSISTKTIKDVVVKPFGWTAMNLLNIEPSFVILVFNVAVVQLSPPVGETLGCIIDMPPNTRLPVSRDDIILDDSNYQIFVNNLLDILELGKERRDVSTLQKLFEEYLNFTSNDVNKKAVIEATSTFIDNNSSYLVTEELFNGIQNTYTQAIKSNIMNVADVEKNILTTFKSQENIFEGRVVITMSSRESMSPVGTFGMSSIVFVNKNYQNNKGWNISAAQAFPNLGLCPYGTKYGVEAMETYKSLIPGAKYMEDYKNSINGDPEKFSPIDERIVFLEKLDENMVTLYTSVLATFEGLKMYFSNIEDIKEKFFSLYASTAIKFRVNDWKKISYVLLSKMSLFKGNQSYGGSQYSLATNSVSFIHSAKNVLDSNKSMTAVDVKKSLWEKYQDYRTESAIITIKAGKEANVTYLEILSNLSPEFLRYRLYVMGDEELHDIILGNSKRFDDYIFCCSMFFVALKNYNDLNSSKEFKLTKVYFNERESFAKYILQKIEAVKISRTYTTEFYESSHGKYYFWIGLFFGSHTQKLQMEIEDWLKMINKEINAQPIYTIQINNDYKWIEFRTSQLISYLFSNEVSENEDVIEVFEKASQHKGKSKLQITEIAINEGTTKPFIPAVLTELIQNSADAIKSSDDLEDKTQISVNYEDRNDQFITQVSDLIGMPPKAFLYVGVPFISTKIASELVTGEMGSGFFNVYRESTYVTIETIYKEKYYVSYDRPIIENNRVVDVLRRVYSTDKKEGEELGLFRGTRITIVCENRDWEQRMDYLASARYTSEKIMSQVSLFNDISIRSNGIIYELGKNKTLMFTAGFFDVYFLRSKENFPSYIFTKGIPFAPLEKYYVTLFSSEIQINMQNNIIINIRQGGYTPVQTRTRINMPKEVKEQFKKVLVYAAFVKAMSVIIDENKYLYWYWDYSSHASASQLKRYSRIYTDNLDNNTASNILTAVNFDLFEVNKYTEINLIHYTNKLIAFVGNEGPTSAKMEKKIDEYIESFNLSRYQEVKILGSKLLKGWIMSKNKDISEAIKVEKGNVGKVEDDKIITPYVKIFLDIFVNKAIKSGINGWNDKSLNLASTSAVINTTANLKNASGYFSHNTKSIHINTYSWDKKNIRDLVAVIKKVKNGEDLSQINTSQSEKWYECFSLIYPSTTVIHELEHARRAQDHSGNSHGPLDISLWEGDVVRERTFDQCANDVFSHVISNGFYDELFLKYKKAGLIV